MSQLILIILSVIFAVQAIRAYRLLNSALWLAGVSALVSLIFYLMSATQVAVIELSELGEKLNQVVVNRQN